MGLANARPPSRNHLAIGNRFSRLPPHRDGPPSLELCSKDLKPGCCLIFSFMEKFLKYVIKYARVVSSLSAGTKALLSPEILV